MTRPLLMTPGPIEISPGVLAAYSAPPPGHVSSGVIEAFGVSLEAMRVVWCAAADSQPFIVSGSGTLAMEMAVVNLLEPGDEAVIVDTGYFSERMAEMCRRRGVLVESVRAPRGEVPDLYEVEDVLSSGDPKVLFATHVDACTGVRVDAEAVCALGNQFGALPVLDGVCATAGERFLMDAWGAGVYLTASQTALGLPPGLALMVANGEAMELRRGLKTAPPMGLDWVEWLPIMEAYEARRGSYFATPATNLIGALAVGLTEILEGGGIETRVALHERAAGALRSAWRSLELKLVPSTDDLAANTLSAIYYPEGVGPEAVGAIKSRGVLVAGGLHPAIEPPCFRVGHMGYTVTRDDWLLRVVEAVATGLQDAGCSADPALAVEAARVALT